MGSGAQLSKPKHFLHQAGPISQLSRVTTDLYCYMSGNQTATERAQQRRVGRRAGGFLFFGERVGFSGCLVSVFSPFFLLFFSFVCVCGWGWGCWSFEERCADIDMTHNT